MERLAELREVLALEVNRILRNGPGVVLLVRAVLEAPEPERSAAREVLGQVLKRTVVASVRRAVPERAVELIDSPDPELRWMGARLLRADETPEALPRLRRGLGDSDARVREACVVALRGSALEPELLGELLRSERLEEREAALELVDARAVEALRPELRSLLGDGAARVRYRAAELLGPDAAPQAWAVTLDAARHAPKSHQRELAIGRLRMLGPRPEAHSVLLEALRSDEDDEVRSSAALMLGELAPAHPEVAQALLAALVDESPLVGETAARVLGTRGATTEAIIPRLLAALEDERLAEQVRGEVAVALAGLGERAVVPLLIRLLERADDTFRFREDPVANMGSEPALKLQAAQAVGLLGPLAAEAVPVLLANLDTVCAGLQLEVARALERIGTVRSELEERLCALLPRARDWTQRSLLDVLARLRPERDESLRLLLQALEEEQEWARASARTRLWRVVRERPELIERIQAFASGADPWVRGAAIGALRVLGRPTAEVLERLSTQLESGKESERKTAVDDLRTLGLRAGGLLRELTERLSRLGPGARAAGLSVLGALSGGRLDEATREALKAGLQDEAVAVREAAAWTLCDFQELDAELVRLAEARRGDPEPRVREAVDAALRIHGAVRAETAPREVAGPIAQAARSIHELGLRFYAALREGEGNRVFSPLSIFTLLAMVLRGARGRTEASLGRALHWPFEPSALSVALRELVGQLHRPTPQEALPHIEEGDEGFALVSANGFWPQRGFPLRAEYLAELAEGFGVTPAPVDFGQALEAAVRTINGWAREHTRGRIPEIVTAGQLSAGTRYVMANAVSFRSRWEQPFYDSTEEEPFHLRDGQEVDVPMMSRQGLFGYASGAGCQLIELPYRGGQASMVVLLPDPGLLERTERLLSREWVDTRLEALKREDFVLKLPRFGFDWRMDLGELAARLGLSGLFEPDVDLTGMLLAREPLEGALVHDASITVDEKGTEAAAVTRTFHIGGVPEQVVVDRPFLFLIRHLETRALLFLGRVMDPRSARVESSTTLGRS